MEDVGLCRSLAAAARLVGPACTDTFRKAERDAMENIVLIVVVMVVEGLKEIEIPVWVRL